MPNKSLWKILKPVKRYECLSRVSLQKRVVERNSSPMVFGVSISSYMVDCGAFTNARPSQIFKILFKKLCILLKTSAIYVFVFDGPQKPVFGRTRRIPYVPPWWVGRACNLISNFGFHTHLAPGDAEAELSALNRLGAIDGIITNNSVVFAFGGKKVIKTPKIDAICKAVEDEVSVYIDTSIFAFPDTRLSHSGLILFSFLTGEVYPSEVHGINTDIALELAQLGFGEQIVSAVRLPVDEAQLRDIRDAWKADIQAKLREYNIELPPSFPDLQILDLFVNPLTSLSEAWYLPNFATWTHHEPSIPQLHRFCHRVLRWRNPDTMVEKLKDHLWGGVFLQSLFSPLSMFMGGVLMTPGIQSPIVGITMPRDGDFWYPPVGREVVLHVRVDNYMAQMGNDHVYTDDHPYIQVEVPQIMVRPEILRETVSVCYRGRLDADGNMCNDDVYDGPIVI